jgi:Flp pilus assembly protein TadD
MSKRKVAVNIQPKKQVQELSPELKLINKTNLIFLFLILIITVVVFWRTTKNGFTDWDDNLYVVNSDLIQQINWPSVQKYFTTLTANLYTPLVTASYAVDFKLYDMNAGGFHATSLLIHAVNVCLVYILTFCLFKRPFVAGVTALCFSIHPLNVEAVVWISSRKDLLFSMFYLLGLVAYLKYQDHRRKRILVLVFFLFILSVLSKPIAFTFPFVLVCMDYLKNKKITRNEIFEKIPFVFVSIMIAMLGIYLVRQYEVFATAPSGYNFFDKVCLAGYSLTFYLYNAIIPADISNYHAYPFKDGNWLEAKYMLSPIIVLLLLFVIYKSLKKNITVIAGLVFFLIVIGPTLRLVPTGYPVAADRYFYLASMGLFWTLCLIFEKIAAYAFPLRVFVVAISCIAILSFGILSFRRVSDWKDSYSLWNSTLKENPYHEVANDHLGKLYNNAGDQNNALIHFQRIITRNKLNYDIMNSAGNILLDKKQHDLALQYFDMAIATGKADHLPYYNRGLVYSEKNQFEKAINDFDTSLLIKPDFAEAYNNRGIAEVKSGDTLSAYRDFQKAVELKPTDKMMRNNLSRIEFYLKASH